MYARHVPHLLAHPRHILLPRARVDDDQVVVLAQLVDHNVVDEAAVGIEHRRVVRLPHLQLRGIVHAQTLHRCQRSRPAKLDVPHVRHVEEADAGAHRHVLGDEARVLDRHVPPAEVDHLRLVRAMRRIQRCLAQRSLGLGQRSDLNLQS